MSDQRSKSHAYLTYTGPVLFVVALIFYVATSSTVPYPGESTSLLVDHLGLNPFPPVSHWLWGFFCRILAHVSSDSIARVMNLFSALCGAASVWLSYDVVARIEHNRTFDESMSRFDTKTAQTLSGACAALYLAVSVPFWIVSTRAHTASFDTLLLLLSLFLLMRFAETGKLSHACWSALVYGLGVTELATMIIIGPIYGLLVLYLLWRRSMLTSRTVGVILAAGCIGLFPYFACAWQNWTSPSHEWRELTNYFRVLLLVWRDQYVLLARGLPKVGWILILLVSAVPFLSIIGILPPGKAMGSRGAWHGNFILNLVLTGLAVGLMFNVTVSPWKLTQDRPLLVTPYVIIAIWAGYLAGYWYVMLTRRGRSEGSVSRGVRRALSIAYVPVLCVVLVVAAVRNYSIAETSAAVPYHRFVSEIVDSMHDRHWLISNGIFDDDIVLAAREKNVSFHVLNPQYGKTSGYLRYVASLFDSPRLKGLSRIGLSPLMTEWWTTTPGIEKDVAVLANPDVIYSSNLEPLPFKVSFLTETVGATNDADQLMAEHRSVWKKVATSLKAARANPGRAAGWCDAAMLQISKVANNFGVYLEDHGRSDLAFEAYREARTIETNNLSALLNMHALARRESRPEMEPLDAELQAFIKNTRGKYKIWSLSYHYGYVRYPEAYASRGWAWAMSGKPNMAINELRRALELGGDNKGSRLALASLYLTQDLTDQSEAIYLAILEKNPDDGPALTGLAHVAMSKSDFDAARGYLARLHTLKVNQDAVKLEEAIVDGMAGNGDAAIKSLSELTAKSPGNQRAWTYLALLAVERGDKAKLDDCMQHLTTDRSASPQVLLTVAHVAIANNDSPEARKCMDRYLRFRPTDKSALETMLKLDLQGGSRDDTERHVEQLLELEPRNALGNFVLGGLQSYRKEYSLAEASFRTSLETWRDPLVLNEMAWVLTLRGAYPEALELVKESIKGSDKIGSSWDTLGYIYLQTAQLDEAEKALQRAMELKPSDAQVIFHMAQLMERKGLNKQALRLTEGLLTRPSEMSPESFEDLRELVKRLRTST